MAQIWTVSTWEVTNYGRFNNQFPSNIIRSIRQFERINKKFVDKKCLICSIKYVYFYIYIWRGGERERERERERICLNSIIPKEKY